MTVAVRLPGSLFGATSTTSTTFPTRELEPASAPAPTSAPAPLEPVKRTSEPAPAPSAPAPAPAPSASAPAPAPTVYIPPIVYQPAPASVFRPAPQQRVSVVLKKNVETPAERLRVSDKKEPEKEELMEKPAKKKGLLVLGGLVAAAGLGWFLWRGKGFKLGGHEGRRRGGLRAHCC